MKKSLAMRRVRKLRSKKTGMAPGTLMYVGEVKVEEPIVSLIEYGGDGIEERTLTLDAVKDYQPPAGRKLWLNVHGLHNPNLIADIGRVFKLHALVLEDILNTDQRAKVDNYDDYLYIVARSFYYDHSSKVLGSEQISLVLGENFVLSFQERPTGTFQPVRERLRGGRAHIREARADYLAYALLDVVVDRYFIVMEQMGEDCETLEDELLRAPSTPLLNKIHHLKRESTELRRSVWPLREVVNTLIRNDGNFFAASTLLYLRDVYDHLVHFIESLESIRDLLGGMLDIYLSSLSNRVNMELRALTVIAMLFMPATLIAGIFGMNFQHMPWLASEHGFWWVVGLMATVATSMGLMFWRRQWLGRL